MAVVASLEPCGAGWFSDVGAAGVEFLDDEALLAAFEGAAPSVALVSFISPFGASLLVCNESALAGLPVLDA